MITPLARLREHARHLAIRFEKAGFVGRAPEQVTEFLAEVIQPIRGRYRHALGQSAEVQV